MNPGAGETQPTECFNNIALPSLLERPRLPTIGRKRTRDFDNLISSDPPLFSSDDLPPSSENYVHKRKKRLYAGTWWGAKASYGTGKEAVGVTRRKRKLERTADSGVWMGSEDTDLSLDDDYKLEPANVFPTKGPPEPTDDGHTLPIADRTDSIDDVAHQAAESDGESRFNIGLAEDSPERRANHVVQTCLDESFEVVDLT